MTKPFPDPDPAQNLRSLIDPQPGDYWSERFCPVAVVLEVAPDSVTVCMKTEDVDRDHWRWDLSKSEKLSRSDFESKLTYHPRGERKTWADVYPAILIDDVAAWVSLGKPATVRASSSPLMYVASRASIPERSAMWRRLRSAGWRISSTWIDEAGQGETKSMAGLWRRIRDEIVVADGLILLVRPGDLPLKGALVEVGMAIALGKPVAIVTSPQMSHDEQRMLLGSWVAHKNCQVCRTLLDARGWIAATVGLN